MRHESSLINHGSSKTDIKELGSTTKGLRRGLNFAHQLLGKHHVRTGRRHKATTGSLSLLKRQQIKARRQRLALKKQLRRALAQQSLLERKMELLHHILDVVLTVTTDCHFTHALQNCRPSVRPSVRLSVCQSQSVFLHIMACAGHHLLLELSCGLHIMHARVLSLTCTMHDTYFTRQFSHAQIPCCTLELNLDRVVHW